EVFPAPRWPTRATLRIRSAAVCTMDAPLLPGASLPPAPMSGVSSHHTAHRGRAPGVSRTGAARSVEGVALHARAQAQDGLGVQLGDPRLGHAEHLADLAQ